MYSSGTNHEYSRNIRASGHDFVFNATKLVRYVKVWVGQKRDGSATSIVQVQPLVKQTTKVAPATIAAPAPAPATPAAPAPAPAAPAPAPATPAAVSGTKGDPHFVTFAGEQYDFHGGCDLVLLSNPGFSNGLGMDIHVRTVIKTWW